MNLIDISTNLAASLLPDETWEEQYKNVFVANSRKPKNSEQKAVFEKELLMARIASDNGHIVFLLPEIPIKKNPDALLDAEFTEFKSVSGGENAVSHRFRDALHQGQNVYLKIDSNITVKRIKQIIAGVLKEKENTGKVYCYITRLDTFYQWNMQDLKHNKAPKGALSLPQADKNQDSDIFNIADFEKKSSEEQK